MSLCPWPGCASEAPGRAAVFCADHHFRIEPSDSRMVLKIKIACLRAEDGEAREHLREQLAGYVLAAIRRAHPLEGAFDVSADAAAEHFQKRREFHDQLRRAQALRHTPETDAWRETGGQP